MEKQQSFADIEYGNRKRRTKRDEFLAAMEEVIPWGEWIALVEQYYPSGKRGRPPRGVETMLRMYMLSNWYNLSDEGIEDAIYDSYAFRKFMRVDFLGEEQVPDATTLCKFRKLLHENGIADQIFNAVRKFLDEHGRMMHGGSIVDATIVDAPTSTKNAQNQRDQEMHSVKKGNQWYFGERIHIGVDAGTGYIHSVEVTAANISERDIVPKLIREDDQVLYGDAGYTGLTKRPEFQEDKHLASIDYRINTRNRHHWKSTAPGFDWDRHIEYQKSRVRAKVEYAFLIIKKIFGYRKVRYRGLPKNTSHARILSACANLYMLARSGW